MTTKEELDEALEKMDKKQTAVMREICGSREEQFNRLDSMASIHYVDFKRNTLNLGDWEYIKPFWSK